tara:strand:+ start:492 stop:680 length:189 start_codon:yes stop_codon:yes gene_type:complete
MGGIKRNTQGKLYTDEAEYLENLYKQQQEENHNMKMRMRGRPKNVPDEPIKKKYGEFIISFE